MKIIKSYKIRKLIQAILATFVVTIICLIGPILLVLIASLLENIPIAYLWVVLILGMFILFVVQFYKMFK